MLIAADNSMAFLPVLSIFYRFLVALSTSVLSILSLVRIFSNNSDPSAYLLTLIGLGGDYSFFGDLGLGDRSLDLDDADDDE